MREGCSCDRDLVNCLNSFLVECRKKGNQNNHNGQTEWRLKSTLANENLRERQTNCSSQGGHEGPRHD